jgi:hypothetical protein
MQLVDIESSRNVRITKMPSNTQAPEIITCYRIYNMGILIYGGYFA